jgi:hypothetical protein
MTGFRNARLFFLEMTSLLITENTLYIKIDLHMTSGDFRLRIFFAELRGINSDAL